MSALRDFLLAPPGGTAPAAPPAGGVPAAGAVGVGAPVASARPRGPRGRSAGRPGSGGPGGFLLRPRGGASAQGRAGDAPTADWAGTTEVGAETAPSAVAVLCAGEDARAVGVSAGVLLARRARASCALVCLWTGPEPYRHPEARPPAGRGARRVAAALEARGLHALAIGRVAAVALPADPAEAVIAARRAAAVAGTAPVVLVLGGPRVTVFDDLLWGHDRVLVVTRPGAGAAMGALALAGAPLAGPSCLSCTIGLGRAGRAVAAAGMAIPAPLRRVFEDVAR